MDNLNTRLDQSLDQIIKDTRLQRKKGGNRAAAIKKKNKKAVAASKVSEASTKGAKKPARRVKNKTKTAALGNDAEGAAIASTRGAIAARLGAGVSTNKVLGKGRLAGRIGKKSAKPSKSELSERLSGVAAAGRRKRGSKGESAAFSTSTKNMKISIKGEAGPATVFVSNLDTQASAEDVETCFKRFGAIKSCTLLYDRNGQASGHAKITYSAKAAAEDAVDKLHDALADGKKLAVELTKDDNRPSGPQMASFLPAPGASSHHNRRGGGGRRTKRPIGGGRMDID
ncbi:hypothetical protein LPJ72_002118 [Coemansia sp. Benny D160-2]|nr:hypothetical protein LPJ72_002118 [Coemansia sp. Benny D160-2]